MATYRSVERITGEPQVVELPEHGTPGSFKRGDLVKLASNGKVQIATAGVILGIAQRDYTGTENTLIPVDMIDSQSLFVARYTASSTTQSLVGDCVDFTFTAGAHTLSESSATTDAYVVRLDPRDAVGTSGGRLIIRFKSTLLGAQF